MARAVGSSSQQLRRDLDRRGAFETQTLSARRRMLTAKWVSLAGLAADPEPWHALAGRALEPNVFLEPAFACAALAPFGRNVGAVAIYAGTRLVGLLPGRLEGFAAARPVPTFVAWTHPFAPLSMPLVDRDLAPDVVAAMLDFMPLLPGSPRLALFPLLAERGAVAQLMAAHLVQDGRRARLFDAHFRAALVPERSGPVTIGSAKKRKELRRQRRRLAEDGALARESAVAPAAVREAIAVYLDVEAASWKGRTGGAAKQNPASSRFLAEAVSGLAAERKARIDLLKFNGKAIAATITLFSGNRGWFWKTGYDEAFARYSPGVQLALDLTESLEADRTLALVDSCAVADHPMIDHLWGERIAVADWLIPLGASSSFAAGVAAERARRAFVAVLKKLRNDPGR